LACILLINKNHLEKPSLLQLTPQVLIPKMEYIGQNLNTPEAKGTMPIQPHAPITLLAAKQIKTSPTEIRSTRSIRPTEHFI